MPALATLTTTTLSQQVESTDGTFKVASTSGMLPGVRLFLDRELATVISADSTNLVVAVQRGVDGTASTRHGVNAVITIGRADQFYSSDPIGLPPNELPVTPYINVVNGTVWTATGDELGPGLASRFWTLQTTTGSAGALGVRVTTTAP